MSTRPAFLNRLLDRLPDPFGLEARLVLPTGLCAGFLGLLFVLGANQLDARRVAEVERRRAETLACAAAAWLDGDAHVGLGQDPAKRLADIGAALELVLRTSAYPGTIRTLRPAQATRVALNAQPLVARAGALEVVLQCGPGQGRAKEAAYRPEMAPALLEGKPTSFLGPERVEAYAPVLDSWGSTTAIVVVEGPADAALWRRVAFLVAASLLAGLLVAAVLWLARVQARRLVSSVVALREGAGGLARGQWSSVIAVGRAPRELRELAESLESLRGRLAARARGEPPPAEPAPLPSAKDAQRAALGEPVEFDLALLVQQLVEPARKVALSRGLELQLVYPDGVPSHLSGHPVVLFQALDALLRNALRSTEQGSITLRVSRAGEGAQGWKLRFEVADTGPGIAFGEQQELAATLVQASGKAPAELRDPLHAASALASALGGELGFETQPGQGSRFAFLAAFQPAGVRPVTAFQPRPVTAFQPRHALGAR